MAKRMKSFLTRIWNFITGTVDHDEDFSARLTQIKGDLDLCEREPTGNAELLHDLRTAVDTLAGDRVGRGDIDKIHRIEAELCLLVPVVLLRPTWWRLREKLYRLEPDEREAWTRDVTRLLPEGDDSLPAEAEGTLRQRLRRLVFDLYTASTRFSRLSEERARVIRSLTLFSAFYVAIGGILAFVSYVWFGDDNWQRPIGLRLLPSAAFAGVIGGAISAVGALTRERPRDELVAVLRWQLTLRCLVGGASAAFVYLTVLSGLVRFNVAADGVPAFLLALGFVAGFSERVFAQTVSAFVIKREPSDGKFPRKKKGNG